MSDNLPVRVVSGATNLSEFTKLVVPTRELSRQEWAVYQAAKVKWAAMNTIQQTVMYAMFLEGGLTKFLSSLVTDTITDVLTREDAVPDPRVKTLVQRVNTQSLQAHTNLQLGYRELGARQLAEIQTQDVMPPSPPPVSGWRSLFEGG